MGSLGSVAALLGHIRRAGEVGVGRLRLRLRLRLLDRTELQGVLLVLLRRVQLRRTTAAVGITESVGPPE